MVEIAGPDIITKFPLNGIAFYLFIYRNYSAAKKKDQKIVESVWGNGNRGKWKKTVL